MGFEPQGENLSLIMVEAASGKGKNTGCYIIETQKDESIKESKDSSYTVFVNVEFGRIGTQH
jgi:hypothetical protein